MDSHDFLPQLLLILLGARFFAELVAKLGVPAVIGELLAGIVLGPSLLGWLQPTDIIRILAEIGIILMLFEVGLETDVRHFLHAGPKACVVALGGFVMPFCLGFIICYKVFSLPLLVSLFVGGTLTATSIGITMRILADVGNQQTQAGQIVLGAAVLDDILGVILLALLYEFSIGGGISLENAAKVGLFVGIFLLVSPVVARLISLIIRHFDAVTERPGLIPTTIVSLVLCFAWLANVIGAPQIIGGFTAGLALSRRFFLPLGIAFSAVTQRNFSERIDSQMRPIVQLFSPIFFVMVGLSLDLRSVDWGVPFIWYFSLSLLVVSVVGKFAGAVFIREPWAGRILTGLAMVPRGEVGLIFAELGRVSGVMNNDIYAGVVLVVAFTTLISPFWIKWFSKRYGHRLESGENGS